MAEDHKAEKTGAPEPDAQILEKRAIRHSDLVNRLDELLGRIRMVIQKDLEGLRSAPEVDREGLESQYLKQRLADRKRVFEPEVDKVVSQIYTEAGLEVPSEIQSRLKTSKNKD